MMNDEFDAPHHYFDFTNLKEEEHNNDADSFFDAPSQVEESSQIEQKNLKNLGESAYRGCKHENCTKDCEHENCKHDCDHGDCKRDIIPDNHFESNQFNNISQSSQPIVMGNSENIVPKIDIVTEVSEFLEVITSKSISITQSSVALSDISSKCPALPSVAMSTTLIKNDTSIVSTSQPSSSDNSIANKENLHGSSQNMDEAECLAAATENLTIASPPESVFNFEFITNSPACGNIVSADKNLNPHNGRRRSVSVGPRCGRSRLKSPAQPESNQGSVGCSPSSSRSIRGHITKLVRSAIGRSSNAPIKGNIETGATAAEFAKTLRHNARGVSAAGRKGPTKVQPFHLHEPRTQKEAASETKFVSLAELNMKFHCETPKRFRTKSNKEKSLKSSYSASTTSLTKPQSPSLASRNRSRPVNHPTREEIEEKEFQEALQRKTKPRPLNKKIFEAPSLPAPPPKPITEIQPFNITQPKKPVQWECLEAVPHRGVPACHQKTTTKPQPFSFETRDQCLLKKKQQKIDEIIAKEKAAAEFHAHPMPVFDGGPKGLPPKKPLTTTKPQPFDLKIDHRAEIKKHLTEREKQEARAKEQRQFRARVSSSITKEPFHPQRSDKPPTEIVEFSLNTEKRSEQRQIFDMNVKKKEEELLEQKRQAELQKQQEEEALMADLRKRITHKARPMPKYETPQIQPSDAQVTVPVSPTFATNERLRSAKSRSSLNSEGSF